MLDGLVGVVPKFTLDKIPIYTRSERMMDVEKQALYYSDTSIWTILSYFDPRRDQKHERPLKVYVHRLSGQFENFLFSQLALAEIETREILALYDLLSMDPTTLMFDFVLGWWDSQAWRNIFPFLGQEVFENKVAQTNDIVFIRGKIKIANYQWKGLTLKFYRMNPEENRDHLLKYPFGWAGYTKCEIVTPKFGDFRQPLAKEELKIIQDCLDALQMIRSQILGPKWLEIQRQTAQKTYARNDRICCWSSTEQSLQGSMTRIETDLTQRPKQKPQDYLDLLSRVLQNFDKEVKP